MFETELSRTIYKRMLLVAIIIVIVLLAATFGLTWCVLGVCTTLAVCPAASASPPVAAPATGVCRTEPVLCASPKLVFHRAVVYSVVETRVNNNVLTSRDTKEPVRVASLEFNVLEGGVLAARNGDSSDGGALTADTTTLKTAPLLVYATPRNDMQISTLNSLKNLIITSAAGSEVSLDVTGVAVVGKDPLTGAASAIKLLTSIGTIVLDGGEDLAFEDLTPAGEKLMAAAGLTVDGASRRLLGTAALNGTFTNTGSDLQTAAGPAPVDPNAVDDDFEIEVLAHDFFDERSYREYFAVDASGVRREIEWPRGAPMGLGGEIRASIKGQLNSRGKIVVTSFDAPGWANNRDSNPYRPATPVSGRRRQLLQQQQSPVYPGTHYSLSADALPPARLLQLGG